MSARFNKIITQAESEPEGEFMKTTDKAYEAINDCLTQIEQAAISGVLEGNAHQRCLEIKSLVYQTRQVLNKSFYITRDDVNKEE